MKCVVTGGAGFIGSHLAENLSKNGHEVIVIDNLDTGSCNNIKTFKDSIKFVKGSILDSAVLAKNFNGCGIVFHLAAVPSVTRSIVNPKATSEVNIQGTLNVLLAARDANVRKVVFTSSSSVYGDTPTLPKKESMQPNPKSPYALSKHVGEQYCRLFSELFGLGTICLRYFNVFGPRQDPKSEYAAVVPKFVTSVINETKPVIYGDGLQSRDFTYVLNVVKANVLAAESNIRNGEIINIACQKSISVNELLVLINKILGKSVKPEYIGPRKGDIRDSLADISLARKLIGYEPDYSMEYGLRQTIEWFKNNT